MPIPVCHKARASRCTLFEDHVAFGVCAAKQEHYYGFKGHIVIDEHQRITAFSLAPANIDERDVTHNLISHITGKLIADKGYFSKSLKEELAEYHIDLQTLLRNNMKETRSKAYLKSMLKLRRTVETAIGQLTEHFNFTKTKAKTLWHLNAKLIRKLSAYNFSLKFC
jgi:IS5 family transposase